MTEISQFHKLARLVKRMDKEVSISSDAIIALSEEIVLLEALTASRLELLREVKKLLDDIYAEDIVSSGDLSKVYEKITEELGDD